MSFPAASADRAFHEFFTAHHAELARLARRLTGDADAADDLTAEALLQVWRCWDRVSAADSPPAYARGIVATLAHNRLRRLTREREILSGLAGAPAGAAEHNQFSDVTDVTVVLDLRGALRRLPYGRRACLMLRYGYGLSERETAKALGVSVGTVKSQTSRGVDQLVRMMDI